MPDKNLKLLIADDHQLFASGLKLILKNEFPTAQMELAANGKEAIDKCRSQHFDIVLMDINMPMISGIEATKAIKKSDPEVKILIVSMLSDFETITSVLKAGADGFLIKNADPSEFLKAFKTIGRDEIYLSGTLAALFVRDRAGKMVTRQDCIQFTENIVTPREKSILKMIAEGHTNQAIADTLFLSVKTVDTHRNNMLAKLDLPNTAALVRFALDNKLV